MKRVLIILQGLGMGGVSSVILNYYKEICDQVIADFVITTNIEKVPNSIQTLIQKNRGIIYSLPHFAGKGIFKYYYGLKTIIKQGKYDVVHDNNKYFGFLSLIKAKRYNVPIRIAHVHNCVAADEKPLLHRFFIRVSSRLTENASNVRIACSTEAGKSMFSCDDFIVLNNSIDPDNYRFSEEYRSKFRTMYSINKDDKVLITVARNDSLKRYDFAFKVFDELCKLNDSYKYVIVGLEKTDLSERDRSSYMEIADDARNKILFLGRCYNANQLLSMADAFLLTSEHEGFGISIIEAQANDLKCFISDAIPQSTKVSELVYSLPCLASQDIWACVIDKEMSGYRRLNIGFDSIRNSAYSIKRCSKQLLDIYNR